MVRSKSAKRFETIGTYGHDTGYNLYCIAVYLVIYVIYYL